MRTTPVGDGVAAVGALAAGVLAEGVVAEGTVLTGVDTRGVVTEGTVVDGEGVVTLGVVAAGVVTFGVVAVGVVTFGVVAAGVVTFGVVAAGVVTFGVVAVGVVPTGVLTEGTVADGTVADGTVSDGTFADGAVTDGTDSFGAVAATPASGWARSTPSPAAAIPTTTLRALPMASPLTSLQPANTDHAPNLWISLHASPRGGPESENVQECDDPCAMRVRSGLAALAILVGVAVAAGSAVSGASAPAPPTGFVSIQDHGNPLRWNMSLYSSRNGKLTRWLASFPQSSFTNNGLALTPNGRTVYFTLVPRHAGRRFYLRLMRIDVATRREAQVAEGAQPAISDDGSQLAYATFPHGLAVRDLATGTTRTISLIAELGAQADLLDGAVTWLADGSDIAIVPSPPAWDLVGHRPPPAHWCGTTDAHAVVVFVHVPAQPAPLTAHCARVAGKALAPAMALAASPASPTSLLIATDSDGDRTQVERIAQTGVTTRLLTIRDSLPLAFDPTGNHLMYLVGHRPPRLWEATIADGHLTGRSRLLGQGWGSIAW